MPVGKKRKKKKRKIIYGNALGYTLGMTRGELDTSEEWISGMARTGGHELTAEVLLNEQLSGRPLLAALIHEWAHIVVDILRLKVNHRDIHSIGNLVAEMLLSTGIVKEGELDRRLDALEK